MMNRPPRGASEQARISDAVSRMAAVLVLAAGGEIKVPLDMVNQADFIELEQDDRQRGFVTYRAFPHRRAHGGDIIEGEARRIDEQRRLPKGQA